MATIKKAIKRSLSLGALVTLGAVTAAAAPQVAGWSLEEGGVLTCNVNNQYTPFLQVVLSEPSSQIHYSVSVNGVKLFDGDQKVSSYSVGKTSNVASFSFSGQLKELIEAGTISVGDQISVDIDAITYGDGEVANVSSSRNFTLTDLPSVSKFYPDAGYVAEYDKNELKTSGALYIYFTNKAIGCDIEFWQNDVKLGTYTVSSTNNIPATTATLKKDLLAQYVKEMGIAPGDVVMKITKVQVDEETSLEGKLGWGILKYMGAPASVVSVSAPAQILSWFPADATEEDAVFSLTVDKPLNPANIKAELQYGRGETNYFIHTIPYTLSDDHKTITVDFRGRLLNVDYLAPGAVWYDESGNIIAPPDNIGLEITGLVCEDGSSVICTFKNPDTGGSITITNRYSTSFKYRDISLATPRISGVQFYNAGNPAIKHEAIEEGDNMALIESANLNDVESFKVMYYYDDEEYIVDGTIAEDYIEASLPAEVAAKGVSGLMITLSDLQYAYEDGVDHTVKPFSCSDIVVIAKVANINELKNSAADTLYSLTTEEGLVVTWADKNAGAYLQDDTNGIKLYVADAEADKTLGLHQGEILKGKFVGTLIQGVQFELDMAKSSFMADGIADVQKGHEVKAEDLTANDNGRLVTVYTQGDDCVWDTDEKIYVLDNGTALGIAVDPAYLIRADIELGGNGEYEPVLTKITSVTGIYSIQDGGTIWLRKAEDIVGSGTGIDGIEATQEGFNAFSIDGVKMDASAPADLTPGLYIINGRKVLIRK